MVTLEEYTRYRRFPPYSFFSRDIIDLWNDTHRFNRVINRLTKEEAKRRETELTNFIRELMARRNSIEASVFRLRINLLPVDIIDIRRALKRIDEFVVPEGIDFETTLANLRTIIIRISDRLKELLAPPPPVFYRNMAVRNYSASVEIDYPFLAEIRATIVTNKPVTWLDELGYLRRTPRMRLITALKITVKNMLMYFLRNVRHAEKKDKVGFSEDVVDLDFLDEYDAMTEGTEINVKISVGEAVSVGKVNKYIRVINKASQDRKKPWIYLNNRIENDLKKMEVIVDERGFCWSPKR